MDSRACGHAHKVNSVHPWLLMLWGYTFGALTPAPAPSPPEVGESLDAAEARSPTLDYDAPLPQLLNVSGVPAQTTPISMTQTVIELCTGAGHLAYLAAFYGWWAVSSGHLDWLLWPMHTLFMLTVLYVLVVKLREQMRHELRDLFLNAMRRAKT